MKYYMKYINCAHYNSLNCSFLKELISNKRLNQKFFNFIFPTNSANQTATKSNQRHHVVQAHIVFDRKSHIITIIIISINITASMDILTRNITNHIRQQNKTKATPVLIKMHSKMSAKRSIMTINHMIHLYS